MGTQSITHPRKRTTGCPYRIASFFRCFSSHKSSNIPILLAFFLASTHLCLAQITAVGTPLLLPTNVAFDSSGALYIAETNRHVIDRIDSTGVLSVYAGNGTQGFSGDAGSASSAQLDSPQGLVVDGSGNLYIADTHNHRIREVAVGTGIISTIAGTGDPGFSGDQTQAVAARLNLPTALALDASSNLYIADSNNHRIRQLNLATGILHTVAGNGVQGDTGDGEAALAASIDTPTGLAVDSTGNLYLADTHNHRIRRVTAASGIITTVAGGGTSLTGTSATAARLLLPRGISFDSAGNLYLADTQAHRILRVTPDSTLASVAGEGTQGFAGDSGLATAALLDSPRSVSISPAGLITLADTRNQRIRQLDSGSIITTLSGTGIPSQSVLILTSPPTARYGTGVLTAALPASTPASGAITFVETTNNVLTNLDTVLLSGNTATFSASHLSAGPHQILASYAGDLTHPAQQSAVAHLLVTPAPISAFPTSATITYGQPIPILNGSILGVFPQDVPLVSATFSTTAQALSPAATYPIAIILTGPSASNYQITSLTSASLTITQAATATDLTVSDFSPSTFSTRTLSATQGIPTGRITFFDTGASTGTATLNASGAATFTTTLTSGSHTVTAVYSGDGNFLSSTSATVTPVVSISPSTTQDFTLTSSGTAAQTAAAGSSAAYSFAVSIVNGPLSSPILLTVTGMPPSATATFNPDYIPPGGASANFTLTLQTAKTVAQQTQPLHTLWAILLWGSLALIPMSLRKKPRTNILAAAASVLMLGSLTACGNNVSSNPKASVSSAIYPMTITATTTSSTGAVVQHTAAVTLTLQ